MKRGYSEGDVYNGITLIRKVGKDNNNAPIWQMRCHCGKIFNRLAYSIKSNHTKSCGCYRSKMAKKGKYREDYIGQKFNKLTAIKFDHMNNWGSQYWLFKCDCGKEKVIMLSSVKRGDIKSCGCARKGMGLKDITGQKFGMLTVIGHSHSTKNNHQIWDVECDCGSIKKVNGNSMKMGGTKSCGCFDKTYNKHNKTLMSYGYETRRDKQKKSMIQVKCHYCDQWFSPSQTNINLRLNAINSYGGLHLYCSDGCKESCPTYNRTKYPKGTKPNSSREVQPALRKIVLERDDWTCQKCGADIEATLHCHHIDPVINNPIESADVDNCITLCKACHHIAHKKPGCGYGELRC